MKEQKVIGLLLAIITIDLITKLIALNHLPFQENVVLINDRLSLYLTFNQDSTGGQAGYLLESKSNKNTSLLLNSIAAFVLLGFVLTIKRMNIKKVLKWLLGIALYIITIIISELIQPILSIEISNWTASLVSKFAGISIYFTILVLVNNTQLKFFLWLIISAGIGNLISHFYYPYRIIDFVNVEGSYELLRIGVFNFADLIFDIGIIGLIITLVAILITRIKKKRLTILAIKQ